jgi:M6 family metalloprotease-like protein
MRFSLVAVAILAVFLSVFAAPYNGGEYQHTQPDGSTVTVFLFGDEYHIDAESEDGYTVMVGTDGYVYYANLSQNGSEYVSSGIRYAKNSIAPTGSKKIRISKQSLQDKRKKNKKALGAPEDGDLYYTPPKRLGKSSATPQSAPPNDTTNMKGITLVMQFPDADGSNAITATATREHVDSVFNHPNFRGTGASVYDWYNDVSNGKMQYKNTVVPYVTVDRGKSYYDNDCSDSYKMVQPLVHSALQKLKIEVESGRATLGQPSTTKRSNNEPNAVLALNIYFAGSPSCGWAKGIWPHQGWYRGVSGQKVTITEDGVTYQFYLYQMSAMGTNDNIISSVGTVVHENGHMIMGWPDLYPYDDDVVDVVGNYCVMATGTQVMPNPQLRSSAGWIDVIDITKMNADLSHVANSHVAYKYTRNAKESYFIEARRRNGRSANIPNGGDGLIIWHVHTDGQNTSIKASAPYPQIKVIQANNPNSTTQAFPPGVGANSPFRSDGGSNNTSFSSTTSPQALYYDGTTSNINLSMVSAVGNSSNNYTMTFRIGTPESGDPTPVPNQAVVGQIRALAIEGGIMFENLSDNSRVELYNIYGKLVASRSFDYVNVGQIEVRSKGFYVARVSTAGTTPKILQVIVK